MQKALNISLLEFEIQNTKMSGFYNTCVLNLQVLVLPVTGIKKPFPGNLGNGFKFCSGFLFLNNFNCPVTIFCLHFHEVYALQKAGKV
jgi:hypothetical protein